MELAMQVVGYIVSGLIGAFFMIVAFYVKKGLRDKDESAKEEKVLGGCDQTGKCYLHDTVVVQIQKDIAEIKALFADFTKEVFDRLRKVEMDVEILKSRVNQGAVNGR